MKNLTLENFEKQILNSEKPCVVTFKNDGCHLCKALTSVLASLERKYFDQFKFAAVDCLVQKDLSEVFDIEGVPTMIFFVDGDGTEIPYPENSSDFSGYGKKYLIDYLESFLNDE
jgi:thioredoxin 1